RLDLSCVEVVYPVLTGRQCAVALFAQEDLTDPTGAVGHGQQSGDDPQCDVHGVLRYLRPLGLVTVNDGQSRGKVTKMDELELGAAFDQHRPRLMAVATRVLGSRPDAEDAVQETW